MGHKERITAPVKGLKELAARKAQLMAERNEAIRAAKADEVPDAAISRWSGLSTPQVRRIGRGDQPEGGTS